MPLRGGLRVRGRYGRGRATASSVGTYASTYRYAPRYDLPHGYAADGTDLGPLTYNASTGLVEGRVFDASYPSSFAVEELLTDQGSAAANGALIEARIAAHAATSGNVRLRLTVYNGSGVKINWGDNNLKINARSRTAGVIVLEAETIKDGTFPRSYSERFQDGDETHAAFFGFTPGGNNVSGSPMFWLQTGASNIRFVGLEFGFDPAWAGVDLASSGYEGARGYIYSGTDTTGGNPIATGVDADYPYNIVVDRCYLHGRLGQAWSRALRINGKRIGVIGCRVRHIGNNTIVDNQAFVATSGSGPYLLENSFFATSRGETVMFGGGNSGSVTEIPQDIQIIDSWHEFPDDWKAIGSETKNLLEFKEADRALAQGCVFRGFDNLTGTLQSQFYAMAVKLNIDDNGGSGTSDQYGVTRNITIRGNDFIDCAGWIAFIGQDNYFGKNPVNAAHRIEFAHNRLGIFKDGTRRSALHNALIQWTTAPGETDEQKMLRYLDIHHNTMFGPYSTHSYQTVFRHSGTQDMPVRRTTVEGNVVVLPAAAANKNGYLNVGSGVSGGAGPATPADTTWAALADKAGSVWSHNALVGPSSGSLIATDLRFADTTAMGIDASGGASTGAPLTGSPLLTADADGGAVGADVALILTATARARSGAAAGV